MSESRARPAEESKTAPAAAPTGVRSRLLRNTLALYALLGANYLFPLIIIPYLLRVIGLAHFGAIALATSAVQFGLVLTEFGFNYTATREVAVRPDDIEERNRVYSVVTVLKIALLGLASVGLFLAVLMVPALRAEWVLVAVHAPMLVGDVLFPRWLFQATQQLTYVTVINIGSRVVTLILLFALVHDRDDYIIAAAVQAGHFTLAGLAALWVARRSLHIRFRPPRTLSAYRPIWRDSVKVFTATASTHVYVRGALLVLGSFVTEVELGAFAIAARIAGILTMLVSPLAGAFYPRVCQLQEVNLETLRRYRNRMLVGLTSVFVLGLILLVAVAPLIVRILTGEETPRAVLLLRAYCPVIFFASMNVVLNIFVMAGRRYKEMRRMYVIAAGLFLVMSVPLSKWLGGLGMLVTLSTVEAFIFCGSVRISSVASAEPAGETPSRHTAT